MYRIILIFFIFFNFSFSADINILSPLKFPTKVVYPYKDFVTLSDTARDLFRAIETNAMLARNKSIEAIKKGDHKLAEKYIQYLHTYLRSIYFIKFWYEIEVENRFKSKLSSISVEKSVYPGNYMYSNGAEYYDKVIREAIEYEDIVKDFKEGALKQFFEAFPNVPISPDVDLIDQYNRPNMFSYQPNADYDLSDAAVSNINKAGDTGNLEEASLYEKNSSSGLTNEFFNQSDKNVTIENNLTNSNLVQDNNQNNENTKNSENNLTNSNVDLFKFCLSEYNADTNNDGVVSIEEKLIWDQICNSLNENNSSKDFNNSIATSQNNNSNSNQTNESNLSNINDNENNSSKSDINKYTSSFSDIQKYCLNPANANDPDYVKKCGSSLNPAYDQMMAYMDGEDYEKNVSIIDGLSPNEVANTLKEMSNSPQFDSYYYVYDNGYKDGGYYQVEYFDGKKFKIPSPYLGDIDDYPTNSSSSSNISNNDGYAYVWNISPDELKNTLQFFANNDHKFWYVNDPSLPQGGYYVLQFSDGSLVKAPSPYLGEITKNTGSAGLNYGGGSNNIPVVDDTVTTNDTGDNSNTGSAGLNYGGGSTPLLGGGGGSGTSGGSDDVSMGGLEYGWGSSGIPAVDDSSATDGSSVSNDLQDAILGGDPTQTALSNVNAQLGNLNSGVDNLNSAIDDLNTSIDSLSSKIDDLNPNVDTNVSFPKGDEDSVLDKLDTVKDKFDETKTLIEDLNDPKSKYINVSACVSPSVDVFGKTIVFDICKYLDYFYDIGKFFVKIIMLYFSIKIFLLALRIKLMS